MSGGTVGGALQKYQQYISGTGTRPKRSLKKNGQEDRGTLKRVPVYLPESFLIPLTQKQHIAASVSDASNLKLSAKLGDLNIKTSLDSTDELIPVDREPARAYAANLTSNAAKKPSAITGIEYIPKVAETWSAPFCPKGDAKTYQQRVKEVVTALKGFNGIDAVYCRPEKL